MIVSFPKAISVLSPAAVIAGPAEPGGWSDESDRLTVPVVCSEQAVRVAASASAAAPWQGFLAIHLLCGVNGSGRAAYHRHAACQGRTV